MTRTQIFSSPLVTHIIGWMIFIAYELTFVRYSVGHSAPLLNYVCYYVLNIGLFYGNAYLLLAPALRKKLPYLIIIFFMFTEVLIYLSLKYLMDHWLAAAPDYLTYIRHLLVPNLYRGISFVAYSTLYWSVISAISFQRQAYQTERARLVTLKEKAELERNLAESMNAYLQQQINPHLLFNTLTFIHNTYHKHAPEAADCVVLLADIMRFSFEGINENGKTALDREIEQVYNFIELNQIRFSHSLCMEVDINDDFRGLEIIPLVLLTLTENIFKHGYLKDKTAPAKLSISLSGKRELHFQSWNLKKHVPENKRVRAIGISNLLKRLDFSYKDHYQFAIKDGSDTYQTSLTICL